MLSIIERSVKNYLRDINLANLPLVKLKFQCTLSSLGYYYVYIVGPLL